MGHYDEEREAHYEKNKGGRPEKVLSDDELSQVEALASVLTTEQIADYFGMGRTTFYEVMKRQPEVSERYKRGRAKTIGSIAKNLIQKAQSGDNAAMIFYLKTQAGWKETTVVDNTSSDGSMATGRTLKDFYADVPTEPES